jgi:hypothetical protein
VDVEPELLEGEGRGSSECVLELREQGVVVLQENEWGSGRMDKRPYLEHITDSRT